MGGNPYNNFFPSFISQFIYLFLFLFFYLDLCFFFYCLKFFECFDVAGQKGRNRHGIFIYCFQNENKTTRGSNSDFLNLSLMRMHD